MNFYYFFPIPKYLDISPFGLDISDRSLKYMRFKKTSGGIRIDKFGKVQMPEGLISSGEIKKRDEVVSFLKANTSSAGIEYAVVALPEEKAFLHTLQLPEMKPSEIRGAIEVQLEEHIPIPPDQIIFDYSVINEPNVPGSAEEKRINAVVAAYPKKTIEEYRDVLARAGIKPVAFEIEAQSMARSVVPEGDDETIMIIDFGKTRTSFVIVSGGHLRYTSTIDVAGEEIDKAIVKAFGVDMYEAERIKKREGGVFGAGGKDDKLLSAVLPPISAIEEEAKRSISFWETHSRNIYGMDAQNIKKIMLCGGDANLTGLPERLSASLNIRAELANVWVNAADFEKYIPEIKFRESLLYTTAIGLGLRALET